MVGLIINAICCSTFVFLVVAVIRNPKQALKKYWPLILLYLLFCGFIFFMDYWTSQ